MIYVHNKTKLTIFYCAINKLLGKYAHLSLHIKIFGTNITMRK